MRQTLFYIPTEIAGLPMFGFGLLLAVWAVASVLWLAWLTRRQGFNADTRSYLPVLGIMGAAIAFVLPAIAQPQGLAIRGYGVFLLLAVTSAVALAVVRAKRRGIDPEAVLSLAFWCFLAGMVGARLFYVVEYWEQYARPTLRETLLALINITQGGLVVYGSMIGGAIALVAYVHKYRLPGLKLADAIAPAVVLGMAIGRVGCFMNGCCYGGVCELPWAVTFPWDSPPHADQVTDGLIDVHGVVFEGEGKADPVVHSVLPGSVAERAGVQPGDVLVGVSRTKVENVVQAQKELLRLHGDGTEVMFHVAQSPAPLAATISGPPPRSLPVHPAQIYSAIDAALLCLLLLALDGFRQRDGIILAMLLTLHPISRYLLEEIRTDEADIFGTGMSISQNVSVLILLIAAGVWWYVLSRPRESGGPQGGERTSVRSTRGAATLQGA